MDWEVFAYGNGELLRLVLNGVTAVVGADDFNVLLRAVAVLVLIWVLVEGALRMPRINFQWLFLLVLVYLTLILPRTDVVITDRVDPSNSGVVGNVPLGLAVFAGISSNVGDWLTRRFETVFSLPDDFRYQRSGALFAHHLIESAAHFEVTDSRLRENLNEFWRQCPYYDMLLGFYRLDELSQAVDAWEFLRTRTARNRYFTYNTAAGTRTLLRCREGANGQLQNDLQAELERARRFYGQRTVRGATPAAAVARFSTAMPLAYQYMAGISRNARQIMSQHMLANAFSQGILHNAGRVGNEAMVQAWTAARAQIERRTTFTALGRVASRNLPLLRGVFEGLIYALFPVVCLFLMLPSAGRVVLFYFKATFWVQLWPPLYAVLNLFVTWYARTPEVFALPGGGTALTLANHSALAAAMAETSAFAGYLFLSIPVFAYLVVFGGSAVAASLATRAMQSYEGPVTRASEEAATGNLSLGNTSMGNASWWQQNSAPSLSRGHLTQTGSDAVTETRTAGGATITRMPLSSLPVSLDAQERVASSMERGAAQRMESSRRQSEAYEDRLSSTLSGVASYGEHVERGGGLSEQLGVGQTREVSEAAGKLSQFTREMREQHGLDAGRSFQVGLSLGGSMGKSLAGARGNYQAQVVTSEQSSEIRQAAERHGLEESFRTVNQARLEQRFSEQHTEQANLGESRGAGLAELRQQSAEVQAARLEARSYQEATRQVREGALGSQSNLDQRLLNILSGQSGGREAALRSLSVAAGNTPGDTGEATDRIRQAVATLEQELLPGGSAAAREEAVGEQWEKWRGELPGMEAAREHHAAGARELRAAGAAAGLEEAPSPTDPRREAERIEEEQDSGRNELSRELRLQQVRGDARLEARLGEDAEGHAAHALSLAVKDGANIIGGAGQRLTETLDHATEDGLLGAARDGVSTGMEKVAGFWQKNLNDGGWRGPPRNSED